MEDINKTTVVVEGSQMQEQPCLCTMFIEMSQFSLLQAKQWHWQTKKYARHMMLGSYYDGLSDLQDAFIESYMGFKERPTKPFDIKQVEVLTENEEAQVKEHLKMMNENLHSLREVLEYPCLQNIVDEMSALVSKSIYLNSLS